MTFSSFHMLDSVPRADFIHILFTSGLYPPGLRLQIRNRDAASQEKTGILFCFGAQKNLDAKWSLAGSLFAQGSEIFSAQMFVRRKRFGSARCAFFSFAPA
jgi:hypothetical protein